MNCVLCVSYGRCQNACHVAHPFVAVSAFHSGNRHKRRQPGPLAPIDEADTKQLQKEFPNADLSKVSKISYHFTLNGLKCHADRVGQYLSQFLGKPGLDFSAYVKPNGGPRVWTMVNNFKPTRSDGCGTVRMEPLTHKDDMSKPSPDQVNLVSAPL